MDTATSSQPAPTPNDERRNRDIETLERIIQIYRKEFGNGWREMFSKTVRIGYAESSL